MLKRSVAVTLLAMLPGGVFADDHVTGDATAGEKVFRKCKACHAVGEGAENKVGPILNGVVDRTVSAVPDFKYSDVLIELGASGQTWTPEELAAFLEKPRAYAKGTKMSFAGLRKEDDRKNIIAYLATFSEEGS
ncbi:c-type cytochrome [Phaeobacter marinintestinus]|uniref:c-type cytochrome n=1 Tax=Falsiphaeobacter marinintestinus TaxID=1492905 RepID=UPI0011B40260|nr:cytochrome c family protein [Phaeobacter marinintestinus]